MSKARPFITLKYLLSNIEVLHFHYSISMKVTTIEKERDPMIYMTLCDSSVLVVKFHSFTLYLLGFYDTL